MAKIMKLDSNTRREIESWDKYHHTEYEQQYQEILDAVEADSIKEYIARVLKSQNNFDPSERFSYVLKDDNDRVVAFTFFYLHWLKKGGHDMFIQSIVVNPKYRGSGYGQLLLGTILANAEKYMGEKPHDVAGFVFPWNINSLRFFDKFAPFERHLYRRKFYLIISDYETIEENLHNTYRDGNVLK